MFLMPYGYNPTTPAQGQIPAPGPRVVDSIMFTGALENPGDKKFPSDKKAFLKRVFHSLSTTPDYQATIDKRIEILNQYFQDKKMSYRFRTRKTKKKEFLLDILLLNSQGDTTELHTRTVTPDNFRSILDRMSDGSGFIFED